MSEYENDSEELFLKTNKKNKERYKENTPKYEAVRKKKWDKAYVNCKLDSKEYWKDVCERYGLKLRDLMQIGAESVESTYKTKQEVENEVMEADCDNYMQRSKGLRHLIKAKKNENAALKSALQQLITSDRIRLAPIVESKIATNNSDIASLLFEINNVTKVSNWKGDIDVLHYKISEENKDLNAAIKGLLFTGDFERIVCIIEAKSLPAQQQTDQ